MNANELANELDTLKSEYLIWEWAAKAQVMLRKTGNNCACGEPLALNTVHRKDKPCYVKEELTDEEYKPLTEADAPYQKVVSKEITNEISKALGLKTVTDEEIIDIWLPFATDGIKGKIAFARAILRKAQEK